MKAPVQVARAVSEQDLLDEDPKCPLCGARSERPMVMVIQPDPRITLLQCGCGAASASRMPRAGYLLAFYRRHYRVNFAVPPGRAHFPIHFEGSDRLARHLLRVLGVPAKPLLRILDFGGGADAAVARALARLFLQRGTEGVEIALVDFNASPGEGEPRISIQSHPDLESAGPGFDVVIASAIMEHIPSPREPLTRLLNALAPGGRAYFRTPSMIPFLKLASRMGIRIEFTYPAHVHDLGQAFWENCLARMDLRGFRLQRSRPALVEADFPRHPLRAGVAFLFKCPWYFLRERYSLVGGWEAVIGRD